MLINALKFTVALFLFGLGCIIALGLLAGVVLMVAMAPSWFAS